MKKYVPVIILVIMLVCSCQKSLESHDFFAMDTYMNISIDGGEEDINAAKREVYRIEELFDRDNLDKNNPEVLNLIDESYKISEFTKGCFDTTIAPLVELWGFPDKKYTVPHESEIKNTLKKVGYNKNSPDAEYDFGAVAKGYAGDRVRDVLVQRGVKSAIVSLGGNIVAVGTRPDGKPWSVGIKNPFGQGYIGHVKAKDTCVVTSGDYERYFEHHGKRYCHIIDPKTGYPAESGLKSVTLISENGVLADALSTAFYVMGEEQTKKFYEDTDGKMGEFCYSVVLVDGGGRTSVLGDVDFTEGE